MRREDVHAILMSRGWLAEIPPALASAVVAAGRLVELVRGGALYHPGDEAGGMYAIVEGGIVVSAVGRDGLPVAGHIVRRCSWFGYASMFNRQDRQFIPRANEPTRVLHLLLEDLKRLRTDFAASTNAFGRLAMRGEAVHVAIIQDLLIANTDRRLAAVLLRVTGAETPERPRDLPIDPLADPWAGPKGVPLTQAILGELVNASPHTVARFVERVAKAGLIDWRYGRVRILDYVGLLDFAAGR